LLQNCTFYLILTNLLHLWYADFANKKEFVWHLAYYS
jgi:hypothetical protein